MNTALMIDFETLSLKENATLLALGAVAVDTATGAVVSEFYSAIDPCQQPGRDIDPSTVLWWLSQSKDSQKQITDATYSTANDIKHVAHVFAEWYGALGNGHIECWSNGAVDHAWLSSMMAYSGLKNPVPYWQQRDYRTLRGMFPLVEADKPDGFIAHHALWDAKYQAAHLVKLMMHLNNTCGGEK